jgi:hypothetical protein
VINSQQPLDTPRRTRRRLPTVAAVTGLLAISALLSACDKPQPTVTVYSGSTAKAVSAQPPCLLLGTCSPNQGRVTGLSVEPGSTVLIDVPKQLADAGWIASAFTQDSTGKNTPVAGAGTTTTTKLTARLQVPQGSGGYFVQISSLKPSDQLTTWIVRVTYGD